MPVHNRMATITVSAHADKAGHDAEAPTPDGQPLRRLASDAIGRKRVFAEHAADLPAHVGAGNLSRDGSTVSGAAARDGSVRGYASIVGHGGFLCRQAGRGSGDLWMRLDIDECIVPDIQRKRRVDR